jgi:hypothetical protein
LSGCPSVTLSEVNSISAISFFLCLKFLDVMCPQIHSFKSQIGYKILWKCVLR